MGMGGLGAWAGRGGGGGAARRAALDNLPKRKPNLKRLWPLIWEMLRPRLWILTGGLLLTVIKVRASLAIPVITRRLIDGVLNARPPHPEQLPGILGIIFGATVIQAAASYALTQLLSKEGQHLITDLRVRVQRHVGFLPVRYYDSSST